MSEKKYILIDEKLKPKSAFDKFKHFIAVTFKPDLLIGLKVTIKQMLFSKSHTLKYPMQKMELNARYRGIHKLLKFVESENERCIGCGLCEKICVSNCISMKTSLGENGRKKVASYSINLSRCVYCGFCADVCPELAIVCGQEYEVASESRIIFGTKDEFLTKDKFLKDQSEFEGYGALPKNADSLIKKTPNAFIGENENETKSDE
ncbi:NADH-quinone oxidoreductase subunit NuoI [Campylobacter concisus]|jgi:NADH-quinone oxidoreductase subunit I|uniref:NADH-quinone oxidoreductase subunit NuoI n=1 Tax=Campylobacter concisus TaxID=199 RepID=UPI000A07465E|nr:NADH-quinone oxidoreductase subunit NuoI [Campylobacter concisus]ORI08859.1 NADH-quinone oxidoreductase subunit I [Campylobacter concisus]